MGRVAKGTIGAILWGVAQVLALDMAGAGHGWLAPFWVSLPLLVLYPMALIGTNAVDKNAFPIAAAIAIGLDLYLIATFLQEDGKGFLWVWGRGPFHALAWLTLWLGWHAALAMWWTRHRSPVIARP